MKIKVGVVDDLSLFLTGFSDMISRMKDFEVVVQAPNGKDLILQLETNSDLPDIMILDTNIRMMNGAETTAWLQQRYPSVKVIASSMDDADLLIIQMLNAGCCSYLIKTADPETVKNTLQQVYATGYFNPDKLEPTSLDLFKKGDQKRKVILTEEEEHYLKLSLSDLSYEEILSETQLPSRLVERNIKSLLRKFSVLTRPGLVLEASRQGFAFPQ